MQLFSHHTSVLRHCHSVTFDFCLIFHQHNFMQTTISVHICAFHISYLCLAVPSATLCKMLRNCTQTWFSFMTDDTGQSISQCLQMSLPRSEEGGREGGREEDCATGGIQNDRDNRKCCYSRRHLRAAEESQGWRLSVQLWHTLLQESAR